MIKTTICLGLLILFLQIKCIAQLPNYSFEFQAGGNAPIVGLKANRYFWLNNKAHFSFSTGLGWAKNITLSNDLTYSIGNGRDFFEMGIAGIYSNDEYFEKQPIKYLLSPLIGYKYISPFRGTFRCCLSPYFADGKVYFWGGISMGFQLKRRYREKENIGTVRFATK